MSKNFTTRTAALKATLADIRKLNTKQISIDGKSVQEIVDENKFIVQDSLSEKMKMIYMAHMSI